MVGKESYAEQQEPKVTRLLLPYELHALALTDLLTIPVVDRYRYRYLFDNVGGVDWVKSISASLGRISRSGIPKRPVPLANNRLVRVDLLDQVRSINDLDEYIGVWENLRFDPVNNILLTKVGLRTVLASSPIIPLAKVRESDGRFSTVPLNELASASVVRLNAGHLNEKVTFSLQELTRSAAPVVSGEYFESRSQTTIKDNGSFATIWGGLYYDFLGIRESSDPKVTDEDLFFESLGIGDTKLGLTAVKIFEKLQSDQRIAMFFSGVTGKPRVVVFLPALNRRLGDGISGVVITFDVRDEDIDEDSHGILTLRGKALKDFAREVIFIMPNGLNGYVLFNNKGKRQDEVPFQVANDTTIPGPHTKRLQAGISCVRCHEGQGHSGWIPAKNDVMTLVENGFDVFGDVTAKDQLIIDTVKELSQQYKGRPDKFFALARQSYQSAMTEYTASFADTNPTKVVTLAAQNLEKNFAAHNYGTLNAELALKRLGFTVVPKGDAKNYLKILLRPDKDSRAFGIVPEDARIAALVSGIPLPQRDFSMIYSFAQFRAQKVLKELRKP